jgi:hypothetical protein
MTIKPDKRKLAALLDTDEIGYVFLKSIKNRATKSVTNYMGSLNDELIL